MSGRYLSHAAAIVLGAWITLAGEELVGGPAAATSAIQPALTGALQSFDGQPVRSPAAAPGDWVMAHLDVETTGLVAGYNEIVDLGVVRVNRALLEKVRAR